jgi:hypothetical protein
MQGRIYPSMIILLRLTKGDEIGRTGPAARLLDESCGAAAEDLRFQTSSSNAELRVQA